MGWKDQSMDHFTNNAHGATHVARSKAQHYVTKSCTKTKISPNTRKFYVDSALIFAKTGKNATYLLSLDIWCLVKGILVLKHTIFQQHYVKILEKRSRTLFFPHSFLSSLFKGKVANVLWEKAQKGPERPRKAQKRAKICPRIPSLSGGAML